MYFVHGNVIYMAGGAPNPSRKKWVLGQIIGILGELGQAGGPPSILGAPLEGRHS